MELKLHYEPVSKDDLKRYAKDTLALMKQNWWLTIKLVVLGTLTSAAIGLAILSPGLIQSSLMESGGSGFVSNVLYETLSDLLWVALSLCPFWMILFFTGFRLMENRQPLIPIFYVIRRNVGLMKSFWTRGFALLLTAFILLLNVLFIGMEDPSDSGSSFSPGLMDALGTNGVLALDFFIYASKGLSFGLGLYWFAFAPLLIYQGLLHGDAAVPSVADAIGTVHATEKSPFARITLFLAFAIADATITLLLTAMAMLVGGAMGFIAMALVRGLIYVFVAGMFYNYFVDKIEGRKITKKVTENALSGHEAPSGA